MRNGRSFGWLSSVAIYVAPMVILTLLFGTLAYIASTQTVIQMTSPTTLLTVAVALYLATIPLLGRLADRSIMQLDRLAKRDALTQLPNRRALHADFDSLAKSGHVEVALALLDLDRFKQVNDHYGHNVGDSLISECARILTDVCGTEAHCYRLGGDEFAIARSGPLAGTILEGICRNAVTRLGAPISFDGHSIVIGASVGISSSLVGEQDSSSELLRRSDVAMYASKRGGRIRCTWFCIEFDRNREAQRELDNELRHALANNEFRLVYQPLVHADSKEIVAVESLIRWDRPKGDPIGPHIFIPVAEESGFINAIDLWVLRRACTDALHWNDITLSVNISPAQLRNPEFPIQLGQIL